MLTLERTTPSPLTGFLSAYHIIGGAWGAAAVVDHGLRLIRELPAELRLQAGLLYGAIGFAFASVILAGVGLIIGRRSAAALAIVLQILQIPVLSVPPAAYSFFAGGYVVLLHTPSGWDVVVGAKSAIQIAWADGSLEPYLGLNTAPLVVIVLLSIIMRRVGGRAAFPPSSVTS